MLDPSDYQNTNGVSSGVTSYINSSSNAQTGQAGGGNWMQQAGSWLNSDSMGQGMGMSGMNNGQMILAADQMGGQIFGMLAGQNETKAGNIIKKVPGLSTIGNFVNAAFGSNINEDFVNQTNYGINSLGSRKFNSKTNADVLNDWRASSRMSHVDKSDVGSDGWFSNKAENKTNSLNEDIDEANKRQLINFGIAVNNADKYTDLRILGGMQAAYGGPINSFRKYYADGGNLNTPQFFSFEPQVYSKGGYLNQAKALIRQNEGWREKPYNDSPKGKNWRSVGYGFNDSGFRDKYPEGISKHYEHGITKKQAEEELDYFLNKAEKQLKSIYGKQWNDFTDSQKAAILDTYYQRPASVGKSSRFYKAVTAGEDAGKYLGVAGFSKRNKIRQGVFGGSQDYVNLGAETESPPANSSSLQEATSIPVIQELDLSGITPTQAKALELNLASPTFDLSMFGSTQTPQESKVPTVGTVEDFLASYGDFGENLFKQGGRLFEGGGSTNGWMDFFKAWGASQGGGNNYFSNMGGNQWKPSSGIQKNTSNGSVQDWLGVAGSAVNTISNWGKEDPSLGRGGGYSDFGMAAYDVMKIIRDATKDRKEPMDKKLGIPIYARGGRLFEGGGSMGAMGYAQIGLSALKLASNAKHQASLDDDIDRGTIDRSINRYGQEFDDAVANVNTNGDLLDLWQNNSTIEPNLTMRDFRDKSYFDDFLNGYAASWEGFNAGAQTGNPYVTAIAAVVGGASSNIASIIGRNKAEDAARETNIKIRKANERRMDSLLAAADRVDRENDYRILQNMGANGGKLSMGFGLRNPFIMPDGVANPLYRAFGGGITHGSNWDSGINLVAEGGSHEQNPYGGVMVGTDEQGTPNLVEENEIIWNGDYVFSRRIKVPKKLREKYKLPEDATFADAVAKLTKASDERPLSNIDRNTQDHILGEFADTQEEMRMAKAQKAMDKQQQLQDDFLMGMQFGLGGHMSPLGIVPDADNISPFEKAEKLFADGGGIFTNPFAYGGAMGNIFEGEGDRPNTLNLDAANQSLVRRIFGDTGFTRFMENTSAALNDPLGYFAGDEINAVIDKLGKMSEPQLERFFRTNIGRAIAPYLADDDNSQVQESGMRGAKSVANIVRRVQRPVQIAAKKAMAQSRQIARSQMKTPKGGGSQKVLNETMTPTQAARQATTGSTEGLPQGWNLTRSNTPTMTTESIVQGPNVRGARFSGRTTQTSRVNPKSTTGRAATSRGTAPDPFTNLEGTLNLRAPISSGNFGYLPWAAGIGAGGYGLYEGIDWLAKNLTNPDGTISGVNDPATQAAINSLSSEATSNRRNNNGGNSQSQSASQKPAVKPKAASSVKTKPFTSTTAALTAENSGFEPMSYDWANFGSTIAGYDPSLIAGNIRGKYKPDSDFNFGQYDNIKDLENSEGYKNFTNFVLNNESDPEVQKYLKSLDDRTNANVKKLYDKNGKLVSNWKELFKGRRTDGIAGVYHLNPNQLDEFEEVTEPAATRAVEDPEWAVDFGDPEVMRNIEAGLNPDGTPISNVGTTKSGFKPKQTWTRNLPWMMSGIMGLKEMLTPADYGNADLVLDAAYRAGQPVSIGTEYIGDYRKRNPFNEQYLTDIINQRGAAANRNFMNLSGGNRAVAMSGILANDLTTQMSLAEAARQAYLANRADDADVAAFNKDTNKFKAQAQNARNLALAQLNSSRQNAMLSGIAQGARLRQAIKDQRDAAISANLSAFAQGLGDLGKENGYYNMLGGLNDEGILKYFYGDNWRTKFNNTQEEV